ncbi:MAG TPA: hypothetical protein VK738_12555 [Terriglobales bacterium]|nr:hypothetical protein [Terriglobales bacterium]
MRLPWISLTSLALLLVLAPHTMSLPPFDFYAADALSSQRTALIILGLLIAVAAFAEFIFSLARHREVVSMTTYGAAALACVVLGWRSYPYWATGVYQVHIGAYSFRLQDPKDLAPMDWIGEFWRLPTLLLYLVCYVAIPLSFIVSAIAFRRQRYFSGSLIAVCTAIAFAFMIGFSPGYVDWIMD